jgi:hypothetical protein
MAAAGRQFVAGAGQFVNTIHGQYLQYAAIGAGVGAGISVLGMGIYGIVEAANKSSGLAASFAPAPGLPVRAASMVSHKQAAQQAKLSLNVGVAAPVPVATIVIGVALCAFCCVVALISVLCHRRHQKRSHELEMQTVHHSQPADWPQQNEDNWPLLPTGSWHW